MMTVVYLLSSLSSLIVLGLIVDWVFKSYRQEELKQSLTIRQNNINIMKLCKRFVDQNLNATPIQISQHLGNVIKAEEEEWKKLQGGSSKSSASQEKKS